MLIDTHAHLSDERYQDELAQMLLDMQKDRLQAVISVGYDMASSFRSVDIASKNKNVFAAVGIHPSEANKAKDSDYDGIFSLCAHEKTVAWGEIGLDYYYPDTDKKAQSIALARQIQLADAARLPVIFHVRDAYEDMEKTLLSHASRLTCGAVMHCFSGSLETAKKYIDAGFYISFSGSITFKNAVKFPDIIKSIPLDKLLIETDCPYLTPVPFRGKLNYPKYVAYQAEKIAEILEMPVSQVEGQTCANAYALFSKMNLRQKENL